jgi:hypothetical protein
MGIEHQGIEEQDDLLREALASYARREPRPGIEERVLQRVRAPRLARRSGWALALLAACVIAMIMIPREETLEISTPRIAPAPPVMVTSEVPRAIERPERFPTPSPLTREERMLMALADTNAFAESGDAGITPIQIDAITVPPVVLTEIGE